MFQIVNGDPDVKSHLQLLLHEQGAQETGLEEFLMILDETEKSYGSWWVAVDEFKEPRVALTVNYHDDLSYIRAVWTRVFDMEDAELASKQLLEQWVTNSKRRVKKFQADLPLYSPLVNSLLETGFTKEKILRATYEVATDWHAEDIPDGYEMRGVTREELPEIYDKLIGPDFDPSSPLYIRKGDFLGFVSNLPDSAFNSWVVVTDDEGRKVGFAGSFLSIDRKQPVAIMYGPHSKEPVVTRAIIAEMLSYWKSVEIKKLKILRTNEFHPNTIQRFDLDLVFESIRFVGDKTNLSFKP
ncbi:MAG: hypothetical protein IH840_09685 [Candidatus Heimdallarchaeota archaeon]|nr:hypothetical protein [Candidatus Heimdallarchaeota archaeon]